MGVYAPYFCLMSNFLSSLKSLGWGWNKGWTQKKRPSFQPKLKSPSPFHSLALASCHCMEKKEVELFSIIVVLLLLYITWKQKIAILRNKRWKQENYLFLPLISITISKKQEKKKKQIRNYFHDKFVFHIFLNSPSPSTQIPSTQESFALRNWSCTLFPKLLLLHSFA